MHHSIPVVPITPGSTPGIHIFAKKSGKSSGLEQCYFISASNALAFAQERK